MSDKTPVCVCVCVCGKVERSKQVAIPWKEDSHSPSVHWATVCCRVHSGCTSQRKTVALFDSSFPFGRLCLTLLSHMVFDKCRIGPKENSFRQF